MSFVKKHMLNEVDTSIKYYDASEHWRARAMAGQLHSGTLVKDKRSTCRTAL